MRTNTKKRLTVVMVIIMVASAGCAGWGTDGPADDGDGDGDSNENDTNDDLEETQKDTNTSEDDSDTDSDSPDSGSDSDSSDSSSTSSDGSDSGGSSDSDQSDSDSGTDSTGDTGTSDAELQGTDPGDSGSSDGDSTTDSDSDSDSDSQQDSKNSDDSKDTDDEKSDDTDGGDGDDGTDGDDTNRDDTTDPSPDTHELKVTVTDPNDAPVEGASVSIVTYDGGADVASGTTNSDGVATFEIPNGDYEAVVTTEGDDLLQPSDQRLVTVNGGDANLNVQMQGSGNGEEMYTLTVYADSAVTLESSGEDDMSETKEPTDGVVTFEVPAGGYMLSAEGYHWADVPFLEEDTEIQLQDTSGSTMDISVVDAETGNPVGGAEIDGVCDLWYTGGDSFVETTSASEGDGIVTVHTGVTPTACDATVTAPGYETVTIGLTAPDDDGRTVELEPTVRDVPEPNESGNETNGNATAALA